MRKGDRSRYRPQPTNFVEVYVRDGFNGACVEFNAHKRNVQQWIDDNGGYELVDRRLRHLASAGKRATVNRVLAQRMRRVRLASAQNMPENRLGQAAIERTEVLGG